MGNIIDLKAADGFTLSADAAEPAAGAKGPRGDPGVLWRRHNMRYMCERFVARSFMVCTPHSSTASRTAILVTPPSQRSRAMPTRVLAMAWAAMSVAAYRTTSWRGSARCSSSPDIPAEFTVSQVR